MRKSSTMWTMALVVCLGNILISAEASYQHSEPFAVIERSETASPGLLMPEKQKSNSSIHTLTPSHVLGVGWNQRCLQICQYSGLPRCVCCWDSGEYNPAENHICKQKHEERTKHSHCESGNGGSNPHCDRHPNQCIQGELFPSC